MLAGPGETAFSVPRAVLYSASWGLGAAIGVALGGWLTLVGGAGAPGAAGIDPVSDLVVVPLAAFGIVGGVHLSAQLITALLRGGTRQRSEGENGRERTEDDRVGG